MSSTAMSSSWRSMVTLDRSCAAHTHCRRQERHNESPPQKQIRTYLDQPLAKLMLALKY
jgi:hypothetical protein